MEELRVLSPTAILGYGFPARSLESGMAGNPHAIAVDAGSTDPGPYFLGLEGPEGIKSLQRFAPTMDADLRPLLKAAVNARIPLIIGSAGGAGGNLHLMGIALLIKRIAAEEGLEFKMAVIPAEIEPSLVKRKISEGKVEPLGPLPALTPSDVDRSVRIVAQMGVEPFITALEKGATVIVAGRASDPAMFAALPVCKGYDKGLSLHMGKVLECGAIAAEPGSGSDVLLGTIRDDHFLVEPMNPERRCTTACVAAHSMYESSDPWRLHEPGGVVELFEVEFVQKTERSVQVSGSRFIKDDVYRVKLEGAEFMGYRTISIGGMRDPSGISRLDEMTSAARERAAEQFKDAERSDWEIYFRVYGRDGVMGGLEPDKTAAREVGLLIEVVAASEELSAALCLFVHSHILHYGYPGRVSTAGNLAFPFSPQDLPAGPVHRFNIYHLMDVDDPMEHFPVRILEVPE